MPLTYSRPLIFGMLTLAFRPLYAAGGAASIGEPVSIGGMLQVVFALSVVLLAFAAVVFVLRRFSGIQPGAGGKIRIVDGLTVGARDRLVLVQVGDAQVLLGLSPGRIQTLHVMERRIGDPAADFAPQLNAPMHGLGRTTGEGD